MTEPHEPSSRDAAVLTMIGDAVLHGRRNEYVPMMVTNIVLGVLAAIVAWGRFGDYKF